MDPYKAHRNSTTPEPMKRKTTIHARLLQRFQRVYADTEIAWTVYKVNKDDHEARDRYLRQLKRCQSIRDAINDCAI
jgi:hypothetical protein